MKFGPPPNWVIHVILVGLLVIFVYHQLYKRDRNSQEWGVMTNELYNFSFEYPLRWDAETFDENGQRGYKEVKAIITGDAVFNATVYLQASELPQLNTAIRWGEERNKKSSGDTGSNYEELELTISDDGKSAKRIYLYNSRTVAVFTENFRLLKCQDVYLVRKHDLITIEFCVPKPQYDDYLPYFERIVASFTPKE